MMVEFTKEELLIIHDALATQSETLKGFYKRGGMSERGRAEWEKTIELEIKVGTLIDNTPFNPAPDK